MAGTKRAMDNADNLKLCALYHALELTYPEFDFPVCRHDKCPPDMSCKIQARKQPRHHCSLFDRLRHPDSGSIRDMAGYDGSKDSWSADLGKPPPTTMQELIISLRELSDDLSNQIELLTEIEAGYTDTALEERSSDCTETNMAHTPIVHSIDDDTVNVISQKELRRLVMTAVYLDGYRPRIASGMERALDTWTDGLFEFFPARRVRWDDIW